MLTLTALITTIIVIAISGFDELSFLTDLAGNWNNGPIINVYSATSCNYRDEAFISDYWPGTITGCLNANTINNRPCGKYGSLIAAQPALPYTKWRGTYLCASRVQATYLDLSLASDSNSCQSGKRSCGKIDTFNNVMYVPNQTPCPLNYLEFIPTGQPNSFRI